MGCLTFFELILVILLFLQGPIGIFLGICIIALTAWAYSYNNKRLNDMGITCPYCGSKSIRKITEIEKGSNPSAVNKNFQCNNCSARF